MKKPQGLQTRAARAHLDGEKKNRPLSTPIVQSSTFQVASSAELRELYRTRGDTMYSRFGNPTVSEACARVAALESAEAALVFSSGMGAITTALFTVLGEWENTHDPRVFDRLEAAPYRGVQALDFDAFAELFDAAAAQVEATRTGLPVEAAIEAIYGLLRSSVLPPAPWSLGDPKDRSPAHVFTLWPALRLVLWGRYLSPEPVRRSYFSAGRADALLWRTLRESPGELRRFGAVAGGAIRDALLSWNEDWRRRDAPPDTEPPSPQAAEPNVASRVFAPSP